MIVPGPLNLGGDRYTPFRRAFVFRGINLTGATFAAQVRDRKDGGTIRADLSTVGSVGTEGIAFVSAVTVGGVPISTISMQINKATMEAMPTAAEIGDDLNLVWDMHITPAAGHKRVYVAGTFTVRAGVTQ